MRFRTRAIGLVVAMLVSGLAAVLPRAWADPNPVATNEPEYLAFGRVFPDPQGCLNQPPVPTPPRVSPFAKGHVCADQFLGYRETIAGVRFLESRFSRYLDVIRLDQAYDNADFRSAGLPASVAPDEDGNLQFNGRERVPLYLFKVTDETSTVPEADRKHFVYSLSIHGVERAGLEGGVRAMEDLVTWAACENGNADTAPACNPALPDFEGPFPKKIVETATPKPVPTAGDVLRNAVVYFMAPNPDGWRRGEFSEGQPMFQRYNGNGMDLNRDWPTMGYSYRPYSPGSEPETRAFSEALLGIKQATTDGHFTGGIDLHGQLTASAFSYTLLGSGQRDFRKNFSTVDQSLRAWADQTARLAWSPYIGTPVAPVADQWGTVIDTIGYQVTGSVGDWIESPIGLGAVGIDNEMSLSHVAPNTAFEPILEQMHIDGNKGLVYSQLASMLTEQDSDYLYHPTGKVGYVFNPKRVRVDAGPRPKNPGLPAQNDIDVLMPCAADACDGGAFAMQGTQPTFEFNVKGPDKGFFNGGIRVEVTSTNVQGISAGFLGRLYIDRLDPESGGVWTEASQSYAPELLYANAGQLASVNDPIPGRYRVRLSLPTGGVNRVEIDFDRVEGEKSPGQAEIDASSMDFFTDLNKYIPGDADDLEKVTVQRVINAPASLEGFDSLVVVNEALPDYADAAGNPLGLTAADQTAYFNNLKAFAEGGGNLVLTDGALAGLESMGIVTPGSVGSGIMAEAPRYNFNVSGRTNLCNPAQPTSDPLAKNVCLPGTAGGTSRQAVEPTPLGYTPDTDNDSGEEVRITHYNVDRAEWQAGCGKANEVECTSALLSQTALGERQVGEGLVRIAGAMFPNPNYAPGGPHDMRFGVASYALTFSSWQIFLNLIDYQRPA